MLRLGLLLILYLRSRVGNQYHIMCEHFPPKTGMSTKCTRTLYGTDMHDWVCNSEKDLQQECKERQRTVKFLFLLIVIIALSIVLLTLQRNHRA